MPTPPKLAAPKIEVEAPSTGWNIDRRQAIGAALALLCVGILIGAKLAGGAPTIVEKPILVEKPCADCAERAIQEDRHRTRDGEQTEHTPKWVEHPPEQAVPGDSSVPEG